MGKGKYNDLINDIREKLLNDEVNLGENEEQLIKKNVGLIIKNDNNSYIDSFDLKIDDIDKYYIFCKYDKIEMDIEKNVENNIYSIIKKAVERGKFISIKLVLIISKMEQRILVDSKEKEIIKNLKGICKDSRYEFIFYNENINEGYEVNIESRIKSLEKKGVIGKKIFDDNPVNVEKKGIPVEGSAYIANLRDIVEIYNRIGNKLFDKNIRFGIKEELDVESSIRKTLEESPEEFWFLNNGVSIVSINNQDIKRKTNKISLHINDSQSISVINGAQTITTAAKYFYHTSIRSDNKDRAIKNAKVLLRVIEINGGSEVKGAEYASEIDKISVSLNRQKPIQPEDIAYTIKFVSNLNEIASNRTSNDDSIRIVRRGDKDSGGYTLIEFAKAAKAVLLQQPGLARTAGKKRLLKITSSEDGYKFSDEEIFKKELYIKANIDQMKHQYNKYYRFISFAIELQNKFAKTATNIKKDIQNEKKLAVLNYGRWYFTAYVVYILNGRNNNDFSAFTCKVGNITDSDLKEVIKKFVDDLANVMNDGQIDSNCFKLEELYEAFCTRQRNDPEKLSEIEFYNSKFKNNQSNIYDNTVADAVNVNSSYEKEQVDETDISSVKGIEIGTELNSERAELQGEVVNEDIKMGQTQLMV